MMSKKVLAQTIVEYDAKMAAFKALKAEIERMEDSMKGELERRGVDELEVGNRVVRWTPYTSQRFDSMAFRKAEPETYQVWVKEVKGHRFSVA